MSLSINNVRGVVSSVSFDNETSSKKLAAVDTFEMVRGGYFKSHKNSTAAGKDGKDVSSASGKEVDAAQTQNQVQNSKVADAKDEAATTQGQSQAQAAAKDAASK